MAESVRNYEKLALDIIRLVGGKNNISSAARCATRLRLVLRETPQDAHEKIAELPGVITVVENGGQFQVVIGPHVGDVFEVVSKELKLDEKTADADMPKEKQGLINRLIQTMSAAFAPICYILAGAGLIQGVLIIVTHFAPSSIVNSGVYQIMNMISWTPFTFLPILIAITASKHFKCNVYVAVGCCLALVNPMWGEIVARIADGETIRFLFIELTETTYTSTVLPPLILVVLLAAMERFLNKHLPDIIKPLFTPVICLAVLVPLAIVVIGPVVQFISNGIAAGYNIVYAAAPPLAAAIVGGFWQVIVIFGVHWGMTPICIANFEQNGFDSIQLFITIAVVAQMAAAFGVFIKSKDKQVKGIALSSGITAIFGITEPTIYGVSLPRKKPFIFACICSGLGSVVASFFGSVNYVYAGLPGLITTVNSMSESNPKSFIGCMAGCAIAIVGTILLIMIYGCEPNKDNKVKKNHQGTKKDTNEFLEEKQEETIVYSPLKGQIKRLCEVNDPTFSGEILGKGIAIIPKEGKLYAPFDGIVASVFETKHAIGLTNENGVELLIHIGLETVNLKGLHFDAKVKDGDVIKKGDLLIEFDLEEIKKRFDTITPVIVANSADFSVIEPLKMADDVEHGEAVVKIKKEKS